MKRDTTDWFCGRSRQSSMATWRAVHQNGTGRSPTGQVCCFAKALCILQSIHEFGGWQFTVYSPALHLRWAGAGEICLVSDQGLVDFGSAVLATGGFRDLSWLSSIGLLVHVSDALFQRPQTATLIAPQTSNNIFQRPSKATLVRPTFLKPQLYQPSIPLMLSHAGPSGDGGTESLCAGRCQSQRRQGCIFAATLKIPDRKDTPTKNSNQ